MKKDFFVRPSMGVSQTDEIFYQPIRPTNDGIEDTEYFLLLCPCFDVQGVPEKLCPVYLKIATKQQRILTNLFHDVALQMFN